MDIIGYLTLPLFPVDSSAMDKAAHIPDEVLDKLRELGLFGIQVPEQYGGLGLGATEFSRLAEVYSIDGGIATTLAAHQCIGFKVRLIIGFS